MDFLAAAFDAQQPGWGSKYSAALVSSQERLPNWRSVVSVCVVMREIRRFLHGGPWLEANHRMSRSKHDL
jgi:hypothetical protein